MALAHQKVEEHNARQDFHLAAGQLAKLQGDVHTDKGEHEEATQKYKESTAHHRLGFEHGKIALDLSSKL